MKRPALQNKRVAVLGMALRARKVFGTFEKRAPQFRRNIKIFHILIDSLPVSVVELLFVLFSNLLAYSHSPPRKMTRDSIMI